MQTTQRQPAATGKDFGLLFKPDMIRALLRGESPKTQTRRIIKPSSEPQIPPLGMTPWLIHGEQEVDDNGHPRWAGSHPEYPTGEKWFSCQYGVGDRIYAKESMYLGSDGDWHYDADHAGVMVDPKYETQMLGWAHHKQNTTHSALFMPKWAARIRREITEIRVQRVSEISEEDAIAEGIVPLEYGTSDMGEYARYWSYQSQTSFVTYKGDGARRSFRSLWNVINSKWTPVRKKGELTHYVSYPWSEEDTPDKPLNAIRNDIPCLAYPNPWVWCLSLSSRLVLSRSSVTEEKR